MKTFTGNRSRQLITLSLVLVFAGSLITFSAVVAAQTNSATTMTNKNAAKKKPRRHKSAAATSGRCDPTKQEQTDLSGTYTGEMKHGDEAAMEATLTITGNNFTITSGSDTKSGRVTAVTTCGYTAATFMMGDLTPSRPGTNSPPSLPAMSLRAKKVGDKLTLTSVPGEPKQVSFTTTGVGMANTTGVGVGDTTDVGIAETTGVGMANTPGAMRSGRRQAKKREAVEEGAGAEGSVEFPWPPPRASASVTIPPAFLRKEGQTNLRDVSEKLTRALNSAGYEEMSWYAVPGGFALVSRFEQCDGDGNPLSGAARFILQVFKPPPSGWLDYAKKLIFPQPGHFRVIVFVVSNHPFAQQNVTVSRGEAINWLSSGTNGLPTEIGDSQFTNDYLSTALVYEFEQASADSEAILKQPSSITGRDHLQKCGLWQALERQ